MTGWEKVAAATLLAVVGLVALNLAVWRRMRAAMRISPETGYAGAATPSVQEAQDEEEQTVHMLKDSPVNGANSLPTSRARDR